MLCSDIGRSAATALHCDVMVFTEQSRRVLNPVVFTAHCTTLLLWFALAYFHLPPAYRLEKLPPIQADLLSSEEDRIEQDSGECMGSSVGNEKWSLG